MPCYDDAAMSKYLTQNLWSKLAGRIFLRAILLGCVILSAKAATSLLGYSQRVEDAAKMAADVADNDYGREQEADILQRITDLLPATEDIARTPTGDDIVHIDNAWLHDAIKKLDAKDEGKRALQLTEISERLQALQKQLQASVQSVDAKAEDDPQARLKQILSRDEYKPDEKKESKLQAWFADIRRKIIDFFAKLFGGRKSSAPEIGGGSFSIFQILLVAGLVFVLVWAVVVLLRRFQFREARLQDDDELSGVREILGEQIDADLTAEDLFKDATELARRGEYRAAIRRAYVATLYDLEQRGKLRLHRAKTNSDYLRELRTETQLHMPVSAMTNRYERVWYGNTAATGDDYAGFIANYQEVTK